MPFSFLWYDLETFGLHPQWDRIAEFAAVRTNEQFEEIDDPIDIYCRTTLDYLPHPDACVLTGLSPLSVAASGLTEREFAARIYEQMIVPGTCGVGYNTIRFDDEFIRSLFYRNFYDPYKREYEGGNTRWDVLDLVRMCRDLRPEGFQWPKHEDGKPSYRLESVAEANGISVGTAHTGADDVRTTIALARLVFKRQPKLFKFYFGLRRKEVARRWLNLQKMEPVLHTSRMFTTDLGCTSIVLPLSVHPTQNNIIISCDLRFDPASWVDLPVEEVRRRLFAKKEELGEVERVALKGIHVNRSPALAPLSTLTAERAEALGLDVERSLRRAEILKARSDIVQKVRKVYDERPMNRYDDPELQIYSGDFFPDEDRAEFELVRTAPPELLKSNPPTFYDRRGAELLWRYIARNYPDSLKDAERERWKSFCATRILTPEPEYAIDFGSFEREVRNRLSRVDTPAKDKRVLKELLEYAKHVEEQVLS